MLVLVVGPSGAGKDTLLDAARQALDGDARFRFARREITRPAAAGGEAHIAVDIETFNRRRAAGHYALHWEAHGHGYGISADIAEDLAAGAVIVANVSRTVIAGAAARFRVRVLEITAPPVLLAQRLRARGREPEAQVAARLTRSVAVPDWVECITIVNDGTPEQGAEQVLAALGACSVLAEAPNTLSSSFAGRRSGRTGRAS